MYVWKALIVSNKKVGLRYTLKIKMLKIHPKASYIYSYY